MRFEERSYGAKSFRPVPIALFNESAQMLIVVTPWGRAEQIDASAVANRLAEQLMNVQSDPEDQRKNVRDLINDLNLQILESENVHEWRFGIELLIVVRLENHWFTYSTGQPSILHKRSGLVQPLRRALDRGSSAYPLDVAPLPTELLGVSEKTVLHESELFIKSDDSLILCSATYLFLEQMNGFAQSNDLDQWTRAMAKHAADMPFWLGQLRF